MSKIAAQINPDGTLTKLVYAPGDEYDTLSKAVGGYIESPSILSNALRHLTMWVNEEGKFNDDCKENPVATLIVGYWGADIICGPLVLTGPAVNGETTSLTDEDYTLIEGYVGQAYSRLSKILAGYQA